MSWLKLDDRLHSHPKIAKAGLAAIGLWTVLLSWAGSYGTNGIIPKEVAAHFAHGDESLIQRLVEARSPGGQHGLLEELPDGTLQLHDFDHYQPSHRRRDPAAARGARSEKATANAAARWGSGAASPETVKALRVVLDALAEEGRSMTSLAATAGVSTSTLTRFRQGASITAGRAERALAALGPLHDGALHAPLHATVHAPPCNAPERATLGDAEVCPEEPSDPGAATGSAAPPQPHAAAVSEESRADTEPEAPCAPPDGVSENTVASSRIACAVHAPDPVPDPDQRESTHTQRARDPGVDPLAVEIQDVLLQIIPSVHHHLFDAGLLAETILGTITARHPSREAAAGCMPLVREAIQETARELGSMRAARQEVAPRDVTRVTTRFVEAKVRNAKPGARGEQRSFGFGAGPKKVRSTGPSYPTSHERPDAKVTPMPAGWEPSEEVLRKLESKGFTREVVAEYLPMFRYQERDQQYEDWGLALDKFLHVRWVRGDIKLAAEA